MTPDDDDTAMKIERVGVLLVRAWLHDQTLVARVTRVPDSDAVIPVTVVLATPQQLHREIARWLDELGVSGGDDLGSENE